MFLIQLCNMPRPRLTDDEKVKRAQARVERDKERAFAHFDALVPKKKPRNLSTEVQYGPARTFCGLASKDNPQLRSSRSGIYARYM